LLQELAKQFEIDQGFVNMEAFQMAKHYKTNNENLPDSDYHNDQIQAAIDFYLNRPSFAIIDKGRTNDERSYIWVENGFYGMGYIDSEVIINDLSQIKEYIPYKTNQYIMQLIFPLHRSTTKGTSS
jgi:DNA polymerase-3 subunit epsilon